MVFNNSLELDLQAEVTAVRSALHSLETFAKDDDSGIARDIYACFDTWNRFITTTEEQTSFFWYLTHTSHMDQEEPRTAAQDYAVDCVIRSFRGLSVSLATMLFLLDA